MGRLSFISVLGLGPRVTALQLWELQQVSSLLIEYVVQPPANDLEAAWGREMLRVRETRGIAASLMLAPAALDALLAGDRDILGHAVRHHRIWIEEEVGQARLQQLLHALHFITRPLVVRLAPGVDPKQLTPQIGLRLEHADPVPAELLFGYDCTPDPLTLRRQVGACGIRAGEEDFWVTVDLRPEQGIEQLKDCLRSVVTLAAAPLSA